MREDEIREPDVQNVRESLTFSGGASSPFFIGRGLVLVLFLLKDISATYRPKNGALS